MTQREDAVLPLEQCNSTKLEVLRLLALLPSRRSSMQCTSDWDCGLAISPALDLAVEQINNRSDLLPCHKLELLYRETGCESTAETVVGLVSGLFPKDGGTVVGILGPTCSLDSKLVSLLTNRAKLELSLVVLHNSGLPLLSDRKRFSHSIGILGSGQSLVDNSLALLADSGWRNIAVLYESASLFYHSLKSIFLESIGAQTNVLYISAITPHYYPLHDVWRSKARIIFVFASQTYSKRLICLAYHMKLVYPNYQWVLVGHHLCELACKDVSVDFQSKKLNCSSAILANIALDKAFLITHQLTTDIQDRLELANTTFDEFLNLYQMQMDRQHHAFSSTHQYRSYSMYDAVWTWATVLNQLLSNYSKITMDHFHHANGRKNLVKTILDEFNAVDFQGVSGHIKFNVTTGFINRPANTSFVTGGDLEYIPDVERVVVLPQQGIVVVFLVIQCVIFVSVVALHIITILYRNSKYIKASSPKLINVAFFGEYIFILTMFLYTVLHAKEYGVTEGKVICRMIWVWLLPLCFTMKMGIVILRTWRLYRIFKHYLNPGRLISNSALLTMLIGMLLVDVILAVIWTVVDPMHFELVVINGETNKVLLKQSCKAKHIYIWIGLGFSYRFILLWIMVALAFLTRSIPNQTFSTNSLRVFSYLFCSVFIIGFSHYYFFLFAGNSTDGFITLNVVLKILAITFILLVITPPILPLILQRGK